MPLSPVPLLHSHPFGGFGLNPNILKGVEAAGYTTPTAIQQQAIPFILEGRDVLGLAQTGTGKTAAFALPIMQSLSRGDRGRIKSLIIAPTRELAEQITEAFIDLGQGIKISIIPIYGGVSKARQVAAIRRGADVVVACPGRLLDLINDGSIDLSHIEVLVLDEADNMCDMGFLPDIRRILKYVPSRRQTLFFSATMPEDIRVLSKSILNDPVNIQVDLIAPAKTVSHALYPVPFKLKKKLLLGILQQVATGRVLIFTRTKHRARRLALDLKNKKYNVAVLQGNMPQNQRQNSLDGFRSGKFDVLVATDIAARGIDVSEISHVINFDMPNTVDAYTHRIGRTGRAEHTGEALTLTTSEDEALVRKIERVLGTRIERRRLSDFDYRGSDSELPNQDVHSKSPRNTQGQRTEKQTRHNTVKPQPRLITKPEPPASAEEGPTSEKRRRRPRRRKRLSSAAR